MNKKRAKLFITIAIVVLTLTNCESVPQEKDNKRLVFSEEFTDKAINPEIWQYSISNPDWRKTIHTIYTNSKENIYIENSKLIIRAIKNPENNQWTSARIKTKKDIGWKHGRIEVSARVPDEPGVMAYISLTPTEETVPWPVCGEINLLSTSSLGEKTLAEMGIENKKYNSLLNTKKKADYSITDNRTNNGFHVYAVDWTEDEIKFFADEKLIMIYKRDADTQDSWPYDKEYGISIELMITEPDISPREIPQIQIDYIRVYQKTEQ